MNKLIELFNNKYPLMQVDDYIKLLFQQEFGPEHLVTDKNRVIDYIKSELNNDGEYEKYYVESIENTLCRFHFNNLTDNEVDTLTKIFMKTSKLHKGNIDLFQNKLQILKEFNRKMENDIDNYLKEGIRAIHHSEIYRNEYKPHYRVIKYEYGVYFNLISKINELIQEKDKLVIAIDGRCGSGKSKLVEMLSTLYDCNVIHIDDYFIPMKDREENWKDKIAGNIDLTRIENEVLKNIRENESYISNKYSCQLNQYSGETKITNKSLTIIEGSYSHHDSLSKYYDYKVFLTCSSVEQKERIIERDRDYYQMFESTWIPMEEKYFETMEIKKKADLVIDNTKYFRGIINE